MMGTASWSFEEIRAPNIFYSINVMQATVSGAFWRVVGTTLALWLPLVPLFLLVRHAISSRSPSRWGFLCSLPCLAFPIRQICGLRCRASCRDL